MRRQYRNTGSLLVSILEIVIGILLLIDPVGFTSGIVTIVGAVCAIIGLVCLLQYFRAEPMLAAERNGLARGLILLLVGFFLVFRSNWVVGIFPLLTAIYGVFMLISGIGKVQWAVDRKRLGDRRWYVQLVGAAATLIFAVLILSNPFTTTSILWSFIALTLIVEAVIDILAFIL